MLALLPSPFRHLLFNPPDCLNTVANEVFESLALLMENRDKLLEARRALLMLGPKPKDSDFGPLESLHQDLCQIGPGFAALLENSLESGELFVESPLHISAYSAGIRQRLQPLQNAADRLNALEQGASPYQSAQIILSCIQKLYPAANIAEWLQARGCHEELIQLV